MEKDFKNIQRMYETLKSKREEYRPLWEDISKYVGIKVNVNYEYEQSVGTLAKDEYIEDPTAQSNVNQFGDYLVGILWGTGDNALKLVPSRYVLEYANPESLQEYYEYCTDQTLYHMNHSDAGFHSILKSYAYDSGAFGTSAVGTFPNKDYVQRISDNALIFRHYGIDNLVIDEGKNGMVEYTFCTYRWRVNRIVDEFASMGGGADEEKIKQLPEEIRKAWLAGNYNQEFNLVFGVFPRTDFDPKLQGARGAKYRGVWFLDNAKNEETKIFAEESFSTKPIAVARMIKVRGEIYGRAAGTMLISTIKAINFMVSTAIMVIEKMANPALGIYTNATGDKVIDTSPNSITVFDPSVGSGQPPIFPVYDVGDPKALVEFLIPYLNDKISTAFKIDALLDFSASREMTATESLQRYAIRGKSLSGMLMQQKTELLDPVIKRAVSILFAVGELGIDAKVEVARANDLRKMNLQRRIIPDAVSKVIQEGRPWFEIRYNNELEKLTRTEKLEQLVQTIQIVGSIASLNPSIIQAVDWFKLLQEVQESLDAITGVIIPKDEFIEKLQVMAEQQQAAMGLQAGQAVAGIQKDMSQARRAERG